MDDITRTDTDRGELTVYLAPAPGSGKTSAMLAEGRRRQRDGRHVLTGFGGLARPLGRDDVEAAAAIASGADAFDVDTLVAARPDVVLVADLARTVTVDGEVRGRWQAVEELLAEGVDVVATLDVQHLESLHDTVAQATGIDEPATVPDEFVRAAADVRLVDATPEDIRRSNATARDTSPPMSRTHRLRPAALTVLRELALLWVADLLDERLDAYRAEHGISTRTSTRERVIVALTGAPGGAQLIRRAARIARDTRGELIGVHILPHDADRPPVDDLDGQRRLLEQLDGRYHEILGPNIADSLLGFAHAHGATQIVLGATRRPWWDRIIHGSIVNEVTRKADHIDVHVISTETESEHDMTRTGSDGTVSARRQVLAWIGLILGYPALTLGLTPLRDQIGLSTVLLSYLLLTVGVSAGGGLLPALVGAMTGFLLGNRYFTEPLNSWQIDNFNDIVALFVFVAVALTVASLMRVILRRTADVVQARSETGALMLAATTLAGEDDPLPLLLEHVRVTFDLETACVLQKMKRGWERKAHAGGPPPRHPDEATHTLDVDDTTVLALSGEPLSGHDLETLRAFAANVAVVLERQRFKTSFEEADRLAAANELRTALLRAVSHDLRTPLSSIKASVTSLLQPDVEWTADATREFLVAVNEDTDRLNRLVGNLLDMGRLETGALEPNLRPIGLEDVVAAALKSLGPAGADVQVAVDETLPEVSTDPALLERAVANLIANAHTHGTQRKSVRVHAVHVGNRVDLIVADRGPGVPPDERERIFEPFQRHGDHDTHENVGLGLAVARGFTEALGGTITLEDTAGGGLTAVLSLPVHVRAQQDVSA